MRGKFLEFNNSGRKVFSHRMSKSTCSFTVRVLAAGGSASSARGVLSPLLAARPMGLPSGMIQPSSFSRTRFNTESPCLFAFTWAPIWSGGYTRSRQRRGIYDKEQTNENMAKILKTTATHRSSCKRIGGVSAQLPSPLARPTGTYGRHDATFSF